MRKKIAVLVLAGFVTLLPASMSQAGSAVACRQLGGLHWIHFDDAEDDEVVGVGFFDLHAVGVCAGVLGTEVNAGVDPGDMGWGPNYLVVGAGVNCPGYTCANTVGYTGGGFGRPGCHLGTTVLGASSCHVTQTRDMETNALPPEVDTGYNVIVPVTGNVVSLCVTVGGDCTD